MNKFQYSDNQNETKTVKESRNLLAINDDARIKFREFVDKLNKDNKYGKNEAIDPNLLINLLVNKYIDNDYEYYITKTNNRLLTYDEHTYLFNIKNDLPESQDLFLNPNHLDILKSKIKDHEWNSPGILNEQMIDYILTNDRTYSATSTFTNQIVEAMYSYDQQSEKKFIPEYFLHCINNKINVEFILQAIADIITKTNDTSNATRILEAFFANTDTNIFIQFLDTNSSISPKKQMGCPISNFLDVNESFKKIIFTNYISTPNFVKIIEKNEISINLSKELCNLFSQHDLFSSNLYRLSINNLNTILTYNNLDTSFYNYITRCLSITALKHRIENSFLMFSKNVLLKINEINEEYDTLKFLFSHKDATTEDKKHLLKHAIKNWELYVLYCHFSSLDDLLANSITSSFRNHDLKTNISSSLLNDESLIKGFIRSVIGYAQFSANDLITYFIPFWKKFISILNSFEGYETLTLSLPREKIQMLQKYAISCEKDNFNNFMIHLITKDPIFFEDNYPEEEYSKESHFQLQFLNADFDNLRKIQKKFFEKSQLFPNPNEDALRYNIYKKAGKKLRQLSSTDFNKLSSVVAHSDMALNKLKGINLFSFSSKLLNDAFHLTDTLDDYISSFLDPESKLLCKTLKYWFVKLCSFIAIETFPYKNDQQGLNEFDRKDENIVSQKNKIFQNYVATIHLWNKEIYKYLSEK